MAVPILADITNLLQTGKAVILDALINSFNVIIRALSDGTSDLNVNSLTVNTITSGSGILNQIVLEAGENLVKERAIRIGTGGLAFNADNSTFDGINKVIGMSTNDANTGQSVTVEKSVFVFSSPVAADETFFVGSAGNIVAGAPLEKFQKEVGISDNTGTKLDIIADRRLSQIDQVQGTNFLITGPSSFIYNGASEVMIVSATGGDITINLDSLLNADGFTVTFIRIDNTGGNTVTFTNSPIRGLQAVPVDQLKVGNVVKIMRRGAQFFLIGGNVTYVD